MSRTLPVPSAVACPVCKGDLESNGECLRCLACGAGYGIESGIPCLFAGPPKLTIRPQELRIKSRAESAETTRRHRQIDFGFITQPRYFYGLYLLLVLAILLRAPWAAGSISILFLADWIYYRRRQAHILDQFESNPLRLQTMPDCQAVDELYLRLGLAQPSMDDWARLAWESTGVAHAEEHWRPQVAERYLEIRAVYEALSPRPGIVLDVGANDGQSCWDFGIGIGIAVAIGFCFPRYHYSV